MRIKSFIERLKWLIQNQEVLKDIVLKQEELEREFKYEQQNKDFSIGGVPDFQKDYVAKLLSEDQKK